MGMGWHEWPLMIFTVLGQSVAGAFIVMAAVLLRGRLEADRALRVQGRMFFLWLLLGIAFVASVLHLGSPLRALNSLNRIGVSGLSNEILCGSLFFAAGGLYWLLAVLGKMPVALGRLWLMLTMALALLFVWAMSQVYQINTVPTWYSGYTTLSFFVTMLIGGPLLGYLLLRSVEMDSASLRLLPLLSCFAALVGVVAAGMQGSGLATIHSAVQQAYALVPDFAGLLALRSVLLALGLGCWLCPLLRGKAPSLTTLTLALILVLAGELVGRGVFYGLHMTVGVAVAG
ncbi:DmsC/YnfH family molybdoenzyme membrane anchor subunit [Edwardsiella piscicida]|uniref:DmsC/YnfH family molybdoenzyme membrane anchor subunit n=1 Tax=Edwardsiella piscicida TaxID=1263550 RepID=UPI0002C0C8B8|nr:DmsC/YnfH family molybdoenzyme membrane anchor subunit [Edwardsiella piscicida]AGH74203.1 anaerobic dimethyl sulfoxide reductase subunit C [Edwardsiella piscicida C07-087]EKS7780885.1 dimethyl sulfoxide reductase anchor subunit [Edwardsiella piscicida]UCQ23240.1 dimethyl sulfoxide reductase anchor subunit [Edwardsiella piscicida]UCQ33445.1 dimethyl sulfoxide reductase anchor subunit [Edwardsiella piscicida]UJT77791.1 dimethyl sulfoxide reductase anchor subunit [Edwardsiella piscicida]